MLGLPRYAVLKSANNNKYLRYVHEDGQFHGHLQFNGEEVISPYSKYELEPAKKGANKGLFHVRCCYNNKYWTRRDVAARSLVTATADEPVEERSNWSCTLFEPLLEGPTKLRLRHVGLNGFVSLSADQSSCLAIIPSTDDSKTIFSVIDWESFLILPKKVVFKGDNGQYLSLHYVEDHPYLTFDSSDVGLPTLSNEVFYTSDGSVRIKSDYNGRFWRRSPNWIWADSTDNTSNDADTLFWPVKGPGDKEVALRNLGNNNFCKRLTTEGKTSCLNAGIATMAKEAILKVEEPVFSRSIYNVDFRLKDARIYDQTVASKVSKQFSNALNVDHVTRVTLTFTKETTETWKASVSLKLGISTTIKTGIPFIAEGKIGISAEFEGKYEWGTDVKKSETTQSSDDITIPANSTVMVSVIATEGKCDVPFSYMQRDTLTNGEHVIYRMDDGIYTGINCYNFKTEVVKMS